MPSAIQCVVVYKVVRHMGPDNMVLRLRTKQFNCKFTRISLLSRECVEKVNFIVFMLFFNYILRIHLKNRMKIKMRRHSLIHFSDMIAVRMPCFLVAFIDFSFNK